MMQARDLGLIGRLVLGAALAGLAVSACSKKAPDESATETAATPNATTAAPAASDMAAANGTASTATASTATAATTAAPAADNTDTLTGAKLADFTGDATKGAQSFTTCKTCHDIAEGVNKIGPSLHNVVGRHSGTIAGFVYSPANKNSGITWTPEKLFQYLEKPQRVVPGTKMTFAGFPDPQTRANVIAYLKAN